MKPHTKVCWCIPPSGSGEFVAAMEDVLKLYAEPYDPARPVICMASRNASDRQVDWQFTADDARIHLKQLYPRIKA